jgi:serine protease 16
MKYPHIGWASWASSAPVLIKNDFTEYDDYVAKQLQAFDQCLPRVQNVFDHFHKIVASGRVSEVRALRNQYNITDDEDDISMLYVLTDILAAIVQYNSRYQILAGLCANVTGDLEHDLNTYHTAALQLLKIRGQTARHFDLTIANSTDIHDPEHNSRSWSYMTCTQVGWFQTRGSLRSPFLNLSYFQKVCKQLFNLTTLANEKEMNNEFASVHPGSSRVFFTNSEVDPWSTMGYYVNDISLQQRALMIPGESHCSDLGSISPSDRPALAAAKQDVIAQMATWLRQWNCTGQCGSHGRCLVDTCVCESGYSGLLCEASVQPTPSVAPAVGYTETEYKTALGCAIGLPIVTLIVGVVVTWLVCVRRPRKRESPLLST